MNDDIPYNEFKRYKGYEMFITYMINKETVEPYARMKIIYKGKQIYNNDIYGDERFKTERIYDQECLSHQRERRLNKLLKK